MSPYSRGIIQYYCIFGVNSFPLKRERNVVILRSILELKKMLLIFLDFKKAWNRANVASPIPPKIDFFVERFLEKGLWLLKTRKKFYSCQPLWGGKLFCPPFQPPKSSVFQGEKPPTDSTTMGFPLPSKKYPLAQQVSRPPPIRRHIPPH